MANNYYYAQNKMTYMYSVNIAVEQYIKNKFFPNDSSSRIVYSTTEYAFKKRFPSSEFNNAMLPFVNYKDIVYNYDDTRMWFNYSSASQGFYINELNTKLKLVPVKIEYSATVWMGTDYDMQVAYQEIQFDDATESPLDIVVNIDGTNVHFYGLFDFGFEYRPSFDNDEWLLKNKISPITLNFTVMTYLPSFQTKGEWSLVDKVILDFGNMHGLNDYTLLEQKQFLVDHFKEEVIPV